MTQFPQTDLYNCSLDYILVILAQARKQSTMRMPTVFDQFLDSNTDRNFGHLTEYGYFPSQFYPTHKTDILALKKHLSSRGSLQTCQSAQQGAFA
jgi:hypothetical protein